MFLVNLPDTTDVLTISLICGAITSLNTFNSVVGIGSSSHDFGGAAFIIDKMSWFVIILKLVSLSVVSNVDSK